MGALNEFINANWVIFYFIYGQVFFLTGFAIALKARGGSGLALGRSLRTLAVFGLLQGLAEWGQVFIPIQATYVSPEIVVWLKVLHIVLIAASFAFLLAFGTQLMEARSAHAASEPCREGGGARLLRLLPLVAPAAFSLWAAGAIAFSPRRVGAAFDDWLPLGDIWARYLMAFPGSVLTSVGLFAHAGDLDALGYRSLTRSLRAAALWFGAYAFFGGLMVQPGSFFPASALNVATVFGTGVPVAIVRALCGMGIAYAIIRSLELFDEENRRRVEQAERSQAVLEERERFGRDLHDSVIQALYGAGLALENARFLVDENPRVAKDLLTRLMGRLDATVRDIRSYIMGLDPAESQARTLRERLEAAVAEFNAVGPPPASLTVLGSPRGVVTPQQMTNIAGFAMEALSNVRKHAAAQTAVIELAFDAESVAVTVIDDGVGFERNGDLPATHHHGLRNMARRAELLGGRFEIDTAAGRGTRVRLTLPYGNGRTATEASRNAGEQPAPAASGQGGTA